MKFWKIFYSRKTDYSKYLDSELIKLWLEDNKDAQTEIYKRYEKSMFWFGYSFLIDKSLAEDVLQEVFLTVLTDLKKLQGVADLEKFLLQITYNVIRNLRRKHRPHVSYDQLFDKGVDVAEDKDYFEDLVGKINKEQLRQAIMQLKPEYREALLLVIDLGLSRKEVAEEMQVPLKQVSNYIDRAHQELRKHFGKD